MGQGPPEEDYEAQLEAAHSALSRAAELAPKEPHIPKGHTDLTLSRLKHDVSQLIEVLHWVREQKGAGS